MSERAESNMAISLADVGWSRSELLTGAYGRTRILQHRDCRNPALLGYLRTAGIMLMRSLVLQASFLQWLFPFSRPRPGVLVLRS
jgi:hypothetical protein